jgi:CRP/FNR family transcriptional regulator/CRP/FNR family cyclic AMP-dependent transcriptional regulator
MNHTHEELIRDVPLLARLPEAELRALASKGHVHDYRSGTAIFHEGDPGDALYIVISGGVRIVVASRKGEEATVALLGPGECVGDLALVDGKPRSASAIASGKTKTLVVRRDDFRTWLIERPKAMLALLETLSLRVRRTDEALADFAFLDLPQRLAKRLLDLAIAQRDGQELAGTQIKITQAELASMLGVSRESVNKQLNQFSRDGWIALRRGVITLAQPESLRTFD